jgi:hypothetical protein
MNLNGKIVEKVALRKQNKRNNCELHHWLVLKNISIVWGGMGVNVAIISAC